MSPELANVLELRVQLLEELDRLYNSVKYYPGQPEYNNLQTLRDELYLKFNSLSSADQEECSIIISFQTELEK